MPDILKAIILGVVQGLTEFLPVSSTGHLILVEDLLDVSAGSFGLRFDAAIHLGTLAAVLVYFRARIAVFTVDWLRSLCLRDWDFSPQSRLAWLILLGTIPAGVAGYLLESTVEDAFRKPALVAAMLILFSGALVLAERMRPGGKEATEVSALDALIVGAAQAVALIPGVSRSGITIAAGMTRGLRREEAATFAFLLSAPVIAAAGGKQLLDVATGSGGTSQGGIELVLAGMLTAGLVGYAAIAFLVHYLRQNPLYVFVVYRILLGLTVLGLVAAGAL